MLLKRVSYHNFRPFIGDQSLTFTAPKNDNDPNVTVIIGDNTFGKSTFVLSFIWCLYGESRFSRKEDILNKKVENEMKQGDYQEASVKIEFEDGNKPYTVFRKQRFYKLPNGKLNAEDSKATLTFVNEEGEPIPVGKYTNEFNEAIRAILPQDLSSFFFFEGEKNNEISRKDLGKSVKTLLGLEAYDKIRTHLYGGQSSNSATSTSVMGYYLSKQNDESDIKAKEAMIKKQDAEENLIPVQKRLEEIQTQIEEYEKKIEYINEQLRKAAPSKELQKRRDQIAVELKGVEEALNKNIKKFFRLFSEESLPLFITPFLSKTGERLNEMKIADKGIKGIEAAAINELLSRGVCLCGTELHKDSLAYKTVKDYINYVPPKSVGTLVRDMKEKIEENEYKTEKFIKDFEDLYAGIQHNKIRINSLEREEKEKLAQIAKIDEFDTSQAEKNLYDYKEKLRQLRAERDRKKVEEDRLKNTIDSSTRELNTFKVKSDKAKEYNLYYRYAEALYNHVNASYIEKEKNMREQLNAYVKELFDHMYSGSRDIYIDEKYNINMTYNGAVVDDTGGLRVIQYFAYVGGLVKLAYQVMKDKDEDGNSSLGEQYPLVLDAAFSHADDVHTKNIAKELSNATSQLIFALMKKDWTYAEQGLTGKVGKMYELKKIDETEVRIIEVK